MNSRFFRARYQGKLLVYNDGTHKGGLVLNPRQPASSHLLLCLCCGPRCSNYPHSNLSVGRRDPCSHEAGQGLQGGTLPIPEAGPQSSDE